MPPTPLPPAEVMENFGDQLILVLVFPLVVVLVVSCVCLCVCVCLLAFLFLPFARFYSIFPFSSLLLTSFSSFFLIISPSTRLFPLFYSKTFPIFNRLRLCCCFVYPFILLFQFIFIFAFFWRRLRLSKNNRSRN